MKPEYVMTRAEKISPIDVLREQNVDVRRELIRKVGIERMLPKLKHKSLDSHGNYELLSIQLSNEIKDAKFLKMLNPSVGTWHVEGVSPECDTVEKALNYRNNEWFAHAEITT